MMTNFLSNVPINPMIDPNCLSVDELMNAVDNNSQFKTTKSDSVNHIQQQELLPLNALNSTGTKCYQYIGTLLYRFSKQ